MTKDYRAFVFSFHATHGILLLHCTRKRKKGHHFQVPGGHVDQHEFIAAAADASVFDVNTKAEKNIRLVASRLAAARELFEETGIDVRDDIHRLSPVTLRDGDGGDELACEFKKRLFFSLDINDDDFMTKDKLLGLNVKDRDSYIAPLDENGCHLMLKLSHEHSGFKFEKNMQRAVDSLQKHSGGVCQHALSLMVRRRHGENNDQSPAPPSQEQKYNMEGKSLEENKKIHINVKNIYDDNDNDDENNKDVMGKKPKSSGLFRCFFCWN